MEVLNTWQDKSPQTDFQQERLQYFVATLAQLSGTDPTQRQALIDKCNQLLKIDPKNFTAALLSEPLGAGGGRRESAGGS